MANRQKHLKATVAQRIDIPRHEWPMLTGHGLEIVVSCSHVVKPNLAHIGTEPNLVVSSLAGDEDQLVKANRQQCIFKQDKKRLLIDLTHLFDQT